MEGSAPRRDRLLRSGHRPVAPGDPLGTESSLGARGPESVVFGGLGAALVPGGSHPSGLRNVALIFKARRARCLEGNLVCTQVCRQKGVNMMQECNCNPDPSSASGSVVVCRRGCCSGVWSLLVVFDGGAGVNRS